MTETYSKATTLPEPSPPPTPRAKRTQADWERDKRELAEEAEGRRALRNHDVPPYFESEFGKAFLLSQVKQYYYVSCSVSPVHCLFSCRFAMSLKGNEN